MGVEAATIAARVVVIGLDKSESDLLRFSRAVNASGDRVAQSGRAMSGGLDTAKGSIERLQGGLGSVNAALGSFGVALGIGAIVGFGRDALVSANSLEKTQAVTEALAGSTDRYNEVLATAREGQALYGGSLQANLAALGSFVNLSNRTGVELANIDNIARRLATVDPMQGIEGAAYALREALSGSGAESLLSLRDRFEIPRDAIAAMGAEGVTAAEKMVILERALNNLGITNEVLTKSAETNAAAFDRLGSSFDNAKTRLGGFLAQSTAGLADWSADTLAVLDGTTKGVERWAQSMQFLVPNFLGINAQEMGVAASALMRYGGMLPPVVEATNDAAAATDRATAAMPPYIGYLQQGGTAVERLTAQLEGYQAAVDNASDAVNRAGLETEVAERSLRDEQAAIESANAAVQDQEQVVWNLERGLRDEAAAIDAASDAVANQERVVRTAEGGLESFTDDIKAAEDAVKRTTREIENQEAALGPYRDAIKAAADAVSDQEDRIEDAERAYGGYEDAIDRANKRLERQKGYTDEAKDAFDSLNDSIKDAQRELDQLKGVPLLGSQALQEQLNAIQDQITAKELALVNAQLGGASEETIKGIREEIDKLQLAAEKLELEDAVANDATRRKIEDFGETVKEMSGEQVLAALAKQQQQVDSLTQQLGPAEQAWQTQVEAQNSASRSVARAERAYERYKESLEPLRSELELLKGRLDDANAALQTEDEKIQPLRESLVGLKRNVDDARDAYDAANKAIDTERELLETLKLRVDDARTAYDNANTAIDTQREYLETLKLRQDDANVALAAAEALLQPFYDKQQILNDKLTDANLALATQKELLDPLIISLGDHTEAAAADAVATNDQATAWERRNAAVRAAPSFGSTPDYLNVPGFRPGDSVTGAIRNGTDADDPRPSQEGINAVVAGGGISSGGTFDSGRSEYSGGHQGLDLQITDGTPVTAPLDLYIVGVGPDQFTATGWTIIATDRMGREWLFAHMQATNPRLPVQEWVGKGTVLGWVGYGHVHVQLRDRPGGQTIDPSQALNDAAGITGNAVTDVYAALGAATGMGSSVDAVRQVEDAAYVIDVSVDALRKAAGYSSSETFAPAMAALKTDLTLALQTLMDIANQFTTEGVEAGSEFAMGAEDMIALVEQAVRALMIIKKYEGTTDFGAAADWFGADLRMIIDKLLDVAHYYETDGVVAAAELYDALVPVLGVIDRVVARVAYFQDYQGLMPNLLDWFGSDARLLVDKMLDIAQYYTTAGVNAAADTLDGITRTLEPITLMSGVADMIRGYRGFPPTILNWIGGDMRALVDKIVDVDRYTREGATAAGRVNDTLLAVSEAMATGMSMSDAVRGYQGDGGGAAMLFGDITEFAESLDHLGDEVIEPWLDRVAERMEVVSSFWMDGVADGISGNPSAIDAAYGMGQAIASALSEGYGQPVLSEPVMGTPGATSLGPPPPANPADQLHMTNRDRRPIQVVVNEAKRPGETGLEVVHELHKMGYT